MARASTLLVTLDATNTCFRITRTVGYHYASVAREFGHHLDISQVDKAFSTAYKDISSKFPNFGAGHGMPCKAWWQKVVTTTLESVGVSTTETLTGISAKLYTDFTGPGNWEVFPDVHPALQQLKGDGISLGVVSNFDERLGMILSQLDLAHYFDFVLSSYEAKCFKPDSRFFHLALEKGSVKADQALHVGDSYELDYLAAKDAGLKALLLVRNGRMGTRSVVHFTLDWGD